GSVIDVVSMVLDLLARLVFIALFFAGDVFAADTTPPNLPIKPRMASAARGDKINSNYVGPLVDVKAHGAVGDGATDDTEAIQAALNLFTSGVSATASGALYFPQGDYKITSSLIYAGDLGHGLHI